PTYNYMCAAAATYLLLFLPHLAPTAIYTLSLHDALPILTKDYGDQRGIFNIDLGIRKGEIFGFIGTNGSGKTTTIREIMGFIRRSEEHTSELQSRENLVCRLLLEKKKKNQLPGEGCTGMK